MLKNGRTKIIKPTVLWDKAEEKKRDCFSNRVHSIWHAEKSKPRGNLKIIRAIKRVRNEIYRCSSSTV